MWDAIEAVHRFLRTDSTAIFVIVIACTFALVGGGAAYIFDKGYKGSPDYRAIHEPQISVEWDSVLPPAKMPASGKVYTLPAYPMETGGGGFNQSMGDAGSDLHWPKLFRLLKCTVTNYSKGAIFNIKANVQLRFRSAVRHDTTSPNSQSGEIFLVKDWPIEIDKIDEGPDRPFVFYVENLNTDSYVEVYFPENVTGQFGVDPSEQNVRVILPPNRIFNILGPFHK